MNSTNIENIQNEEIKTSNRIFSNSDLELEFSNINNINSADELNNNNHENNGNNNQINNNNNDNDNNINNNNINDNNNNNNNINNNNINNNNINNINDIMDILLDIMLNENIENQEIDMNKILNSDLINELIIDKFIFRKDYYNQKIDENNKLYVSWLKKIYISNFYNQSGQNILIRNKKIEVPDYPILKKNIEDKLFFCLNPQCNSIIYMTDEQKNKLDNISDLIYYEGHYKIRSYEKVRCPLCLKYKCIYCNKISTLLNSNCCIRQLQNACAKYNIYFSEYYNLFKIMIFVPIIRSLYIACMINFEYFRALTMKDKLMQSKKRISIMIQNNIPSNIISGTYQSKFKRNSMIIISLLNIFGSICWALPYILFLELLFSFTMFLGFCTKNKFFKYKMKIYYLLAFIPGLRRRANGEIIYII